MSRSRFEVSWDVRARLTATDRRSWAISKAFGRGPSARRPPYLLQNCAHTGRLVDAASAVNVWGLGQTLAVPCYRHNIQKNTITAKGGVVKTGCLCYRTRLPRLWLWGFLFFFILKAGASVPFGASVVPVSLCAVKTKRLHGARRGHAGLFTRLKGRVESPPRGQATASFFTVHQHDSIADTELALLAGCLIRIAVRNDGRCRSRGPRLVTAAADATACYTHPLF